MHMTLAESTAVARQLARFLGDTRGVDIVIAPSYTALQAVAEVLKGTGILVAAQNAHWDDQGAYTGEVSPIQLKDAGCRFVLVGHSERRSNFGETDEMVRRKLTGALKRGLSAVLCVGETLEQRRTHKTADVVTAQLEAALAEVVPGSFDRLVVAYEPVWAIGTGQVAAGGQISDVHALIRQRLDKILGPEGAERVRVVYGGSVTTENIAELAAIKELGGVLVGGASLKADGFSAIVKTLEKIKQ